MADDFDVSGLETGYGGGMTSDTGADFSPGGGWWSGFGDVASSIFGGLTGGVSDFGSFAKALLPFLGIGSGVMQAVTGAKAGGQLAEQTKIAEQNQGRLGRIADAAIGAAAPLSEFSKEQLAMAQSGKIPPAEQARIDQWVQGAKQLAMDRAARSGMGNSDTARSWLAWIDQQAVAMQQAVIASMEGLGIQAGTGAGGILGQAGQASSAGINSATQQQQTIEGLIAAANQTLSRLNAGAQ